jgi:hypothetical protein
MRGVDQLDPGSCESEIFRGRGFPSSGPRTSRNAVEGAPSSYVCGLGSAYPCRWSLNSIFRGFLGREFLEGLLLLIVGFGYP